MSNYVPPTAYPLFDEHGPAMAAFWVATKCVDSLDEMLLPKQRDPRAVKPRWWAPIAFKMRPGFMPWSEWRGWIAYWAHVLRQKRSLLAADAISTAGLASAAPDCMLHALEVRTQALLDLEIDHQLGIISPETPLVRWVSAQDPGVRPQEEAALVRYLDNIDEIEAMRAGKDTIYPAGSIQFIVLFSLVHSDSHDLCVETWRNSDILEIGYELLVLPYVFQVMVEDARPAAAPRSDDVWQMGKAALKRGPVSPWRKQHFLEVYKNPHTTNWCWGLFNALHQQNTICWS
ncbi:hypothetical protein OF83DRAFT_1178889 [Amylostereum chailletii]|nr:hypothetical protein OF83DRAFT_1178889 [Amylostereum chailletii]